MKSNYRSSSMLVSALGLSAVFVLLFVIAQTVRPNAPGSFNVATSATIFMPPFSSPVATETPYEEPTPDLLATDNYAATLLAESIIAGATLEYFLTNIPLVNPTPRLGIIEEPGITHFPRGSGIHNVWQNLINGEFVQIGFGQALDDPTQGAMYMFVDGRREMYFTPLHDGPIRVIAAQDNRLTLVGESGMIFYFDVPGRRFVDSLTEVVPTITPFTPPPTATPTITDTPGPTATEVPTCVPGITPGPGEPACR